MKNETKINEQKSISEELPERNPSAQEKPSPDAIAWGRPTVAPYDRGPWVTVEMPELDYIEYLGRLNRAVKPKLRKVG